MFKYDLSFEDLLKRHLLHEVAWIELLPHSNMPSSSSEVSPLPLGVTIFYHMLQLCGQVLTSCWAMRSLRTKF